MKTQTLLGLFTLLATPVLAADSPDVTAAAAALDNQPNYSWKQTVVVPPDSQFQPGPTQGQLEKGGYVMVSSSFGGNDFKYVIKGTNGAVYSADNGWQGLSELDQQGPGRFMGRMIQNFRTPAQQATNLLAQAASVTKDGDAYSGDMTADGAKTMLLVPRRSRRWWRRRWSDHKQRQRLREILDLQWRAFQIRIQSFRNDEP